MTAPDKNTAAEAVALLREFQWCAGEYGDRCPECGRCINYKGHYPDCRLAAALSSASSQDVGDHIADAGKIAPDHVGDAADMIDAAKPDGVMVDGEMIDRARQAWCDAREQGSFGKMRAALEAALSPAPRTAAAAGGPTS